jgi:hypothetical protein
MESIETSEIYVSWIDFSSQEWLDTYELAILTQSLNRYLGNSAHVRDIGQQPFRTLFLTVEALTTYKRETIIHDIVKVFQRKDGYRVSKDRYIHLLPTGDGSKYKYVSTNAYLLKLELNWFASICYDEDVQKPLRKLDKLAKEWFIPVLYNTNEFLIEGVRIADVRVKKDNKLVLYLLLDVESEMEASTKLKKELLEDEYNALTIDPDTQEQEQILITLGE